MSERIEGVPVGTKLVRVGIPKHGQFIIDCDGNIQTAMEHFITWPIIEPDNVYGEIDIASVPIPEGYERDGATVEEWFREPTREGQKFTHHQGGVETRVASISLYSSDQRRIILRKIAPKTKRVVILESDDPETVRAYAGEKSGSLVGLWRIRLEDRPL